MLIMKKIKNIVFDLGGVIITIDQPQAVRRFKEIGLADAEQKLDPYTQTGIFGDLEGGKIDAEEFRVELGKMIGHDVTFEQCLYGWQGYASDVPQRNLEALRRLRSEGYRTILLSNTNPYMMSWALSCDFDGAGHPLSDFLDAMYVSYKCKMMKPDERIFRHVLEAENISPDETLFVDDGPRNIATAAGLGIHTFQPVNGEDWTDEIYKHLV